MYKIKISKARTAKQKRYIEGRVFKSSSSARAFLKGSMRFSKDLKGKVVAG